MFTLLYNAEVTMHPYRTARVGGMFFTVERCTDAASDFEEELAKRAGYEHTDNHVVYSIKNKGGDSIHVLCSDCEMTFGSELIEKRW